MCAAVDAQEYLCHRNKRPTRFPDDTSGPSPLPATGAAYADEGNADLVAFLSCIDGSYARHVAGAFVVP